MMNSFLKTGITSALFFICGFAVAAKSPLIPYSKTNSQIAETRIVGGEEAIQENWPWMTAYVGVFTNFLTSLSVNNVIYETRSFTSGVGGQVSGEIIACGIGDAVCVDATGNVCLIERGIVDFSEKSDNCEAGGGIGAIIYNNEEVDNITGGTLGEDYTGTIPIVAVNQKDGLALLEQIGNIASLAVSETTELQQDASCGASFLGDKWVLTAAHCVDSENANQFKMNVGEYDLSNGAENAIDIANIYIHPQYDADAISNDIALIELASSSDAVGVKIADPDVTDQYAIENSLATVAGWGGRAGYAPNEGPTSDFPDILHKVDLRLTTNAQCREELGESFGISAANVGVTDVMICAAIPEGGRGSCQGDSGGPLVVNTGSGVQQVGIVSWGFGCAASGYPGVYTRVSEFKDWISAITDGIAITQRHNFGLGLEGEVQTTGLAVTNNSETNVGLSFAFSDSNTFTLDASNCPTLDAGNSCQVSVSYLPTIANNVSSKLIITTDDPQVQSSSATVTAGTTLGYAVELAATAGSESDAVTLFSGGTNGASAWVASSTEVGIESTTTGDLQDSIFVASIEGEGVLTFDWAVSSEANTLVETDPDFERFDALFLYLNGDLVDVINGNDDEISFTEYSLNLSEGINLVNWTYSKDPDVSEGDDKGFIRNLVFTATVVAPPPVAVVPIPAPPNSSGGAGSLGWILLCLVGLIFRLRTKH
ncbi:trypsin-like serine protease [Paraglaciecola psychrophila]|nr:trypsin-like serine protease [Paraglaciecola psychrophila]